jgi:hypothetical protein
MSLFANIADGKMLRDSGNQSAATVKLEVGVFTAMDRRRQVRCG